MDTIYFPSGLPKPVKATVTAFDRGRFSDLPGPLAAAGMYRDYHAQQDIELVLTGAEAYTFHTWWRDAAYRGGAAFAADWPLPSGAVGGVRRFIGAPKWARVHGGSGTSVWGVSFSVEIRGVNGVTTQAPVQPAGTLLLDQSIPNLGAGGNWASTCDIYIPDGTVTRCCTWLHGGGGDKDLFARSLGIMKGGVPYTAAKVSWDMLAKYQTIAVIPRGQYCSGVTNAWNPLGADVTAGGTKPPNRMWSNRFTWSQQNDVGMLSDLRDMINSSYPGLLHGLAGHSLGGMMTKRCWYELPAKYSKFATISGPAPNYYAGVAMPGTVQPMLAIQGGHDTNLDVFDGPLGPGSHFFDAAWIQRSESYTVANVAVPPGYYHGEFEHFKLRVAAYNTAHGLGAETVRPDGAKVQGVKVGVAHYWSHCGNQQVLREYDEAGHQIIRRNGIDGYALQQVTGRRVFAEIMTFMQQA